MDQKEQIIKEYLEQGSGYRKLAEKYGISRTTICKWVHIYQGIHNLPPVQNQQKYYISAMNSSPKKQAALRQEEYDMLQQKLVSLEKQLKWEKLRADTLDTMINVAEEKLNISIRKKPGSPQSKK